MKKLLVLLFASVYCVAGIATEPSGSWIIYKSSRMDIKKISFGVSNARIVQESGKILKVPIALLSTYSIDGKLFNKMPVYKYGRQTGEMAFMELIGTRGELKFYRYETFNYESVKPQEKVNSYAIYNGDELHLALTDKTLENVCKYFGLEIVYK